MTQTTLLNNASTVLDRLVGIKSEDSVLLISDPTADSAVLAALTEAIHDAKARPVTISMPEVLLMGDEVPRSVEAALAMADIVVLVVRWLPAWVATRGLWRAIHEYGTRVLQLDPPHGLALVNGVNDIELEQVSEYAEKVRRTVESASGLLIVDRFGNELRCNVDSCNIQTSSEFPFRFGFGKFPTGLFTVSVVPGTYEGRITWDAVEGYPMVDGDLIEADVADGIVQRIGGHGAAKEHVAEKVAISTAFAQLTEFGLGINPAIPEEQFLRQPWHEGANRSAGIVHFGLGSSRTGEGRGDRPFHTHLVSRAASVYALPDVVPVIKSGRI